MKTFRHYISLFVFAAVLSAVMAACIKNDLPYPRIPQRITSIAAVGQSRDAYIDSLAQDVTIYLEETTDIENVRFSEFTLSPGGESDVNLLEGTYNLSQPLHITVSRYQTYNWTIVAKQDIERYFSIEGQVG